MPIVELLGDRALQSALLSTLTIVYARVGEYAQAVAVGQTGLRIALEIDSAEDIVRGYINASQAIDNAGRVEEALELGIEGISVADRLGMSRGTGDQLRQQAAWRLQRIGRLEEAQRMLRPALENATAPFNIAASHALAGRLAVERGELDLAQLLLDRAWPLMQRSGGFQLIGLALAALVLLELRRGELTRARERIRDGLDLVSAEPASIYNAEMYWLAVRVEAELAERARPARDQAGLSRCEQTALSALETLDVGSVFASPVALGSGTVKTAHGLLPVPGSQLLG